MDNDRFITEASIVHGDAYDYSRVEYINSVTKVCIVCPEHGEFWQLPSAHIRGNKCPKCANRDRGNSRRLTKEKFVDKAVSVHGNLYNYDKAVYVNAMTPIIITCPEHGDFKQIPCAHLSGQGCPKCSGRNLTQNEVIERFREVHGDRYNYSMVRFSKMHDKVCIICPEHGEFWQTPSKHLLGQGCRFCGYDSNRGAMVSMWDFLERSKIVHGSKYDYSEVYFNTVHDKIKIRCLKHGVFYHNVYDHLNGHGCPSCGINISKGESEIFNMLNDKIGNNSVCQRDGKVFGNGMELGIYIPSAGIGIDYDGSLWHSESKLKGRHYHLDKTELCEKSGIRLIHVFEDEYVRHKEVVNRMLCDIVGLDLNLPTVNAYECNIKEVRHEIGIQFINRNSIFGNSKSSVYVGAFYEYVLVGVMSFLKLDNDGNWMVSSYATDPKFNCRNVLLMIFNYFRGTYDPKLVKAFSDRRWFGENDDIYNGFGFELVGVTKPDYTYVSIKNPEVRIPKSVFRSAKFRKEHGISNIVSELAAAKSLDYSRIWDCGVYRYEWRN